jgi:cytokinin dehydrogenase
VQFFSLYFFYKIASSIIYRWDNKMSAVTPTEEIFYAANLLWAGKENETNILENYNNQILNICEQYKFGCKEYLPHYTNQKDWQQHFGKKWSKFVSRKNKFDPKALLSPGQQIFAPLSAC